MSLTFAAIHICKPHKSAHNQSLQISMPARHAQTDGKALAITASKHNFWRRAAQMQRWTIAKN